MPSEITDPTPEMTEPAHNNPANDVIMSDEEETSMSLPLSKIKRIFKMDPDYTGASASAVYATGAATELFVQYLVEQASMNAKVERRKKIQYKDLSSTVSAQESLYFLSDTIPKTQTVKDALKEKKINASEEDKQKYSDILGEDPDYHFEEAPLVTSPQASKPQLPKGQSTLPFQTVPEAPVRKAGLMSLMSDASGPDGMAIDP